MNPLLLGRNGRLLLPILALLLMNSSVAEAKPTWAEGTKGNFAMVVLIITSILVGSGIIGAILYLYAYRTLVRRRSMPSDKEISNQIRESKEWLAYTEWLRADEGPTAQHVERAAAARVLDLERQLFGVPPPSSPPLSRLFSRPFMAAKNDRITLGGGDTSADENSYRDKEKIPHYRHTLHPQIQTADEIDSATTIKDDDKVVTDQSANENSRRDKGKCPQYRRTPHPKIQTADENDSATTIKDDGKVVTYDSVRSVKSKGPCSESTAHKAKSATTKDCDENSIRKSISSSKSTDSSRTSTVHRTKYVTIKDDGKKRTHRSRSSNTNADKNHEFSFSKHYVITPPPNAHTVATSSKYVEIPNCTKPATASRHGSFAPSPSDEFAPYPYHHPRQPRRARKPVPIIHHYT